MSVSHLPSSGNSRCALDTSLACRQPDVLETPHHRGLKRIFGLYLMSTTLGLFLLSSLATTPVQASWICASTSSWMGVSREKERARALRVGANPRTCHNLRWPAAFGNAYNFLHLSRTPAPRVEPHRPDQDAPPACKNHCTFLRLSRSSRRSPSCSSARRRTLTRIHRPASCGSWALYLLGSLGVGGVFTHQAPGALSNSFDLFSEIVLHPKLFRLNVRPDTSGFTVSV